MPDCQAEAVIQVCGLYDVSPALFGQRQQRSHADRQLSGRCAASTTSSTSRSTRGLASGVQYGGGVDTGRSVNDACFDVDSPGAIATALPGNLVGLTAGVLSTPTPFTRTTINGQPICRVVTPFEGQTQFKGFVTYPLPHDFVVSAVFQNISGPTITANYAASNAEIAPSLGRNLAACGAQVVCTSRATVPLIVPQTSSMTG